jgi:hypothetical protein
MGSVSGSLHRPRVWVGDLLQSSDSVFSDVSLLCHKVGTTNLPIGHHAPNQDSEGKGRYKTIGRRSRQIMPRNMYRVSDNAADLLKSRLPNMHLAMF